MGRFVNRRELAFSQSGLCVVEKRLRLPLIHTQSVLAGPHRSRLALVLAWIFKRPWRHAQRQEPTLRYGESGIRLAMSTVRCPNHEKRNHQSSPHIRQSLKEYGSSCGDDRKHDTDDDNQTYHNEAYFH